MTCDQFDNQAAGFGFCNKIPQVGRARGSIGRGTHGLLYRGKPAVEYARIFNLHHVREQTRSQSSQRVQSFTNKKIERAVSPFSPDQLC